METTQEYLKCKLCFCVQYYCLSRFFSLVYLFLFFFVVWLALAFDLKSIDKTSKCWFPSHSVDWFGLYLSCLAFHYSNRVQFRLWVSHLSYIQTKTRPTPQSTFLSCSLSLSRSLSLALHFAIALTFIFSYLHNIGVCHFISFHCYSQYYTNYVFLHLSFLPFLFLFWIIGLDFQSNPTIVWLDQLQSTCTCTVKPTTNHVSVATSTTSENTQIPCSQQ